MMVMRLSLFLVAMLEGILIVCFYMHIVPAVCRWDSLNGLPPSMLLVVVFAGLAPILIVLLFAEDAAADYTVIASIETMREEQVSDPTGHPCDGDLLTAWG